jgi:hypothetical protein
MAWSGQRRNASQSLVLLGDAQSSGPFQETGPNPQESLEWHPGLLPSSHHLSSHRVHQRHHPNRTAPRQRLPQLREPQSYLLLDGWLPQPPNPISFYPSSLAKRRIFLIRRK